VYRTISPPQAGGNFTKQLTAVDLTPDFRQNVLGRLVTLTDKKAPKAARKGKGRAEDADYEMSSGNVPSKSRITYEEW
jgi:hypothetical protein